MAAGLSRSSATDDYAAGQSVNFLDGLDALRRSGDGRDNLQLQPSEATTATISSSQCDRGAFYSFSLIIIIIITFIVILLQQQIHSLMGTNKLTL